MRWPASCPRCIPAVRSATISTLIRSAPSGRYTDAELLALGAEQDSGFDRAMFAQQLSRIADVPATYATQYGVDAEAFAGVRARLFAWALELRDAARG